MVNAIDYSHETPAAGLGLRTPKPESRTPRIRAMTTVTATTVTLTIDGKPVAVPQGTLLIEAAKQAAVEVPSFWYFPGLGLTGARLTGLVSTEKITKRQADGTPVER